MASIERTREICDALREWDSPTVSNAIELLEHRDRTLASHRLRFAASSHNSLRWWVMR